MSLDKRNLKVLTTGPPGSQEKLKKDNQDRFENRNNHEKAKDRRQDGNGQRQMRPAMFGTAQIVESGDAARNVKTEAVNAYGSEDAPKEEKKFTGRCRLFVGNLSSDVTEEEFKDWFKPFGEFTEIFLNLQKSFGFIKMVSNN